MTDQNKTIAKPPAGVRDQVAFMSFINDLIKEKNDLEIKPEQLIQIKTLLLKELNEKINTHLVALLPEKEQIELDGLLNKNVGDEELDNFFQSRIPNLIPEMTSVLLDFRAGYLYSPVAKKSEEIVDQALKEAQKKDDSDLPPPAPVVSASHN